MFEGAKCIVKHQNQNKTGDFLSFSVSHIFFICSLRQFAKAATDFLRRVKYSNPAATESQSAVNILLVLFLISHTLPCCSVQTYLRCSVASLEFKIKLWGCWTMLGCTAWVCSGGPATGLAWAARSVHNNNIPRHSPRGLFILLERKTKQADLSLFLK